MAGQNKTGGIHSNWKWGTEIIDCGIHCGQPQGSGSGQRAHCFSLLMSRLYKMYSSWCHFDSLNLINHSFVCSHLHNLLLMNNKCSSSLDRAAFHRDLGLPVKQQGKKWFYVGWFPRSLGSSKSTRDTSLAQSLGVQESLELGELVFTDEESQRILSRLLTGKAELCSMVSRQWTFLTFHQCPVFFLSS